MTAVATLPRLKMCKSCSDIAIAWDGNCMRHTRASRGTRGYSDRPNPTAAMKNPFGMELECIGDGDGKLNVVSKYACSDASLDQGGVEVKIIADARKIADKGADTAQRLRLAGGRVTDRCGFHVHMSRPVEYTTLRGFQMYKNITSQDAERLLPYLKGMEAPLFAMMPNSRRDNHYCRAIGSADSIFEHYSWLSISNRVPTIELRIHPGTLNPWKVKAWAEFCIGLQEMLHSVLHGTPNAAAETARAGDIIAAFPANSLAAKYLQARKAAKGDLKKFGF